MAKASHETSHCGAAFGWSINQVRPKPSEWLVALCAALNPARALLVAVPATRIRAQRTTQALLVLRYVSMVLPCRARPLRRGDYCSAKPCMCVRSCTCTLCAGAQPVRVAAGAGLLRQARRCELSGCCRRLPGAQAACISRCVVRAVTESGFSVSATSAASAGAETKGEDGAGDVAASGEHALTMQRLCLTALAISSSHSIDLAAAQPSYSHSHNRATAPPRMVNHSRAGGSG